MSNHTPIKETTEEYVDVVARHLAYSLRMCDKAEDVDLTTYYNQNHTTIENLAKAWVSYNADTSDALSRYLCYANQGLVFDFNHFDYLAEIIYDLTKKYWHSVVAETQKALDKLI